MTSRIIEYTDYDGVQQKREFFFNFTEAEIAEMQLSVSGGMQALIRRISETRDNVQLIKLFKQMVLDSYGEKSLDGQRFVKTPEIKAAFEQCPAYSKLFMELASDAEKAAKFLNDIMPESVKQNNIKENIDKAEKELSNTIQPAAFLSSN